MEVGYWRGWRCPKRLDAGAWEVGGGWWCWRFPKRLEVDGEVGGDVGGGENLIGGGWRERLKVGEVVVGLGSWT